MPMQLKPTAAIIVFATVLAMGPSVATPTDFEDMPGDNFDAVIDHITDLGIMEACHGSFFCPHELVTREDMAVWLERVEHYHEAGVGYSPPAPTGVFEDVPIRSCVASWIEALFADGITAGCEKDPPLYCPEKILSRAEMAVFLIRVQEGAEYEVPPCSGIFDDVSCPPVNDWPPADYIEDLYNKGVTAGCVDNGEELRFCPRGAVTREQMAAFLTEVMNNKYCDPTNPDEYHPETCWNPSAPEQAPEEVSVTLDDDDFGHELVGR